MEAKYRDELKEHFGIQFNHLFTMTNLPVKRFADFLYRRNELEVKLEFEKPYSQNNSRTLLDLYTTLTHLCYG